MTASVGDSLLDDVMAIVVDVGRSLAEFRSSASGVRTKGSIGDLVTDLDESVELTLGRQLRPLVVGSDVLGEEHRGEGISHGHLWVIDPIDGTTNLVHGVNHSAVSVALVRDRVVWLGVVLNPFSGDLFYATRNNGAYRRSFGQPDVPLSVSRIDSLKSSLLSFGLPYDRRRSHKIFDAARIMFSHCQDLRRSGSAALDLVSVAQGKFEGHFELDLRFWDVAAAGLILVESGGLISDWSGRELNWGNGDAKQDFVASNKLVHEQLLNGLR
ncbi:inositol monophosphatase family protein [Mycobacterium sp. ST-F2]|uniref:inositol monophosphatase family protein n=1 Tax=Mycobacterium sp. ST-F2 TaxID=1490484 RepID=UPI00115368A1|nr:inositol monophosphatase family protein [Mycobacterium sp. ST-F2]